ncbi:HAD-IIA family hydrolase [Halogranum rubrum]|uniref:Sugar phosphatase of had superfamily n=1 Tax=Halogranum salarium B-1 TaxID=1210908 RepID=J3F0F4_9EURY|nr:HAD-IIA family hydrolase [Halogranum salarium]EJN61557.1 sugar phosphatase of had superfamily [Halogranum salarium B-1]
MTYRGAVLDVDGTVVRGDTPIPGARDALDALDDAGIRRLFLSNNPTKAPRAYVDRFERAGFAVDADEVMTSGTVTVSYLAEHHATDDLFVVGESGFCTQLDEEGLTVVDDPNDAETVVVSIDREFTYDRLTQALHALDGDVPFVGTDPDVTIPTDEGLVPGSGAIIRAVAGVAERDPDRILGKPDEYAQQLALDYLGVPAEDCLVVGDRLNTDIALGARAGMTTVLVRTGVTDQDTLNDSDVEPDYVLDSIADIGRVLNDS